ncbi:MAG: tRNA adenosine(34) deaminase TadA [Acidobacteriota bacterium]
MNTGDRPPASPGTAAAARPTEPSDEIGMEKAISEAHEAERHGDVPIGAAIVKGGEIIAAAGNRRELDGDPTAHAEINAIREAAEALGGWRLPSTTLCVTLEPCAMCAGAIVLARIPRVVIGASDPKAGAAGSVMNLLDVAELNHRPEVVADFRADECAALLTGFFASRR